MISKDTKIIIPRVLMKELDGLPDEKQKGNIKRRVIRGNDIIYEIAFDNFDDTRYIPEEFVLINKTL